MLVKVSGMELMALVVDFSSVTILKLKRDWGVLNPATCCFVCCSTGDEDAGMVGFISKLKVDSNQAEPDQLTAFVVAVFESIVVMFIGPSLGYLFLSKELPQLALLCRLTVRLWLPKSFDQFSIRLETPINE